MNTAFASFARRLWHDAKGIAAVETVLVMPALLAMALGAFEVSRMIARQTELQAAMAQASSVALATEPTSDARRATLQGILQTSTGLGANNITLIAAYRCGTATAYVSDATTCGTARVSSFLKVTITDSYTPTWTQFGVGSALSFNVTRYVMIKQQTLGT